MRAAGGGGRLKHARTRLNFSGMMLHCLHGNGSSGISGQRSANRVAGTTRASGAARASATPDGLRITPAIVGLEVSGPALLDARNKVTITARIQGYQKTVKLDRNDPVKVGQVLAQLESEDIANQLAASVADAEAADRSISEARSDQERAHASAEKAKLDYDRKRGLREKNIITEGDWVATEAAFRQTQAELARSATTIAKASAMSASAEANVKLLEVRLRDATIRSPLNGVVVSRDRNVEDLLCPARPSCNSWIRVRSSFRHVSSRNDIRLVIFEPQAMQQRDQSRTAFVNEAKFLFDPGTDMAGRARQRRADEYFQCLFLRGAQKARASAHVKTGQALDPTLFKQFEPAADRVVVQQQRSSDFLTTPTVVQKHQGVCASRHTRGHRPIARQRDQLVAILFAEETTSNYSSIGIRQA